MRNGFTRRSWSSEEDQVLIDYYYVSTFKEIQRLLPYKSAQSIYTRVKVLRREGKMAGKKSKDSWVRTFNQLKR